MKKVIEFLRNNIKEKDSLVVACSGGPDSMCLLDLVTKLKDELNLTIIVAHVNHKLRIESDEEAKMVEKYAKDHNLIFESIQLILLVLYHFPENILQILFQFLDMPCFCFLHIP